MNKHHNYFFFFQLAFLLGCCFNVPKNSDHVLKPHEAHSLKSIHFSEGNRHAPQKRGTHCHWNQCCQLFYYFCTFGNTVSNRKHVVPVNPVSWNKRPKKKAILPLLFILILSIKFKIDPLCLLFCIVRLCLISRKKKG